MSRPRKTPIVVNTTGPDISLPQEWSFGDGEAPKKRGRPRKKPVIESTNPGNESLDPEKAKIVPLASEKLESATILHALPKTPPGANDTQTHHIPSAYVESSRKKIISISQLIGKNYAEFWNCKKRYRILKGSRSSKKSVTTAFNYIVRMMAMPDANLLCLRRYKDTHKRSCFSNIQWCIYRLGVAHLWSFTVSPMEATYIPTGQKIYFAGLDEPLKLTSITVPHGVLCWVWFEEVFEIKNPDTFEKIDQGIRGEMPAGYFKQITMTFNPWAPFWVKYRFYDLCDPCHPSYDPVEAKRIWCGTTNWMMNEFLDAEDCENFLALKRLDPAKYEVAGLGKWGSPSDIIYPNYKIEPVCAHDIYVKYDNCERGVGLDFGFVNYGAAIQVIYNYDTGDVWIVSERIHREATNQEIAQQLHQAGFTDWLIVADSSEPKSIRELKHTGLWNIHDSRSGPDTIMYGIQLLRGLKLHIDPSCTYLIDEIAVYTWDTDNETGEKLDKPADYQKDHCLDALRYVISYMYRNSDRNKDNPLY